MADFLVQTLMRKTIEKPKLRGVEAASEATLEIISGGLFKAEKL